MRSEGLYVTENSEECAVVNSWSYKNPAVKTMIANSQLRFKEYFTCHVREDLEGACRALFQRLS